MPLRRIFAILLACAFSGEPKGSPAAEAPDPALGRFAGARLLPIEAALVSTLARFSAGGVRGWEAAAGEAQRAAGPEKESLSAELERAIRARLPTEARALFAAPLAADGNRRRASEEPKLWLLLSYLELLLPAYEHERLLERAEEAGRRGRDALLGLLRPYQEVLDGDLAILAKSPDFPGLPMDDMLTTRENAQARIRRRLAARDGAPGGTKGPS